MRKNALPLSILLGAWLFCFPGAAGSQELPQPGIEPTHEVLPDVSFEASYLKFASRPNVYSPYYSWDARLAFDAVVFRHGPNSVQFGGLVQSAGTENFGSRIGVGGTGYVMALSFRRVLTPDVSLTMGLSHLSTHLTRDLDEKTVDERQRGALIPVVADPPEYNAPFLEWSRRFPTARFAPEIAIGATPVNIRLSARSRGWNRRPVYVDTRWRLWARGARSFVLETAHEAGAQPLNRFVGALEIDRPRTMSSLQLFASFSPGRGMHVSPRLGGVRDGLALGVKLSVRSSTE